MKITTQVEIATLRAYADCHGNDSFEVTSKLRNLDFRASAAVTRDEAVAIMAKAIEYEYNEFDAELLNQLPDNALVTIARESSVCIYVKGKLAWIRGMKADEWDYDPTTDETRIWYD